MAVRQRVLLRNGGAIGGDISCLEARQPGLRANQQPRAAIGQNMRDLQAFQNRVDRHVDKAGPRRRQGQQASELALCAPTRHPRTRFGHNPLQPGGKLAYTVS